MRKPAVGGVMARCWRSEDPVAWSEAHLLAGRHRESRSLVVIADGWCGGKPEKKTSINHCEQCRTGGGCVMLQSLSAYEVLAVALVGPESRSVTTRGVAESTFESRQQMSVESSTDPSGTSQEEEPEEEPLQTPAAVPEQEEEEEEKKRFFLWGGEQPAVISFEMDESPGPSGVQVVTPRHMTLHTPTPRRFGQHAMQSPTMEDYYPCAGRRSRSVATLSRGSQVSHQIGASSPQPGMSSARASPAGLLSSHRLLGRR
uniref:uncharacterized protein n=1 Tax=Pristiophorus japonicus TaxID=55135 RepID=UPI00398EC94E